MLTSAGAQLLKSSHLQRHIDVSGAAGVLITFPLCANHIMRTKWNIWVFCPEHLFPISVSRKHPSAANAASSSVQLRCPKGLLAHTLLQQTGYEHIYLANCWCCIEHHIRESFHVYHVMQGRRRCPHGSSLLFNRKVTLSWSISMA